MYVSLLISSFAAVEARMFTCHTHTHAQHSLFFSLFRTNGGDRAYVLVTSHCASLYAVAK